MKIGDAFLLVALFAWVTVSVGPWYVGVGLFSFAWILNILVRILAKRRA